MDTGGFAMYIVTVLGPWWQTQKNSSDDRMLLVCDNASVHTADDLKEKLDQHGIILRFLPPNMTQWLQPLDLVVCGLSRQFKGRAGGSIWLQTCRIRGMSEIESLVGLFWHSNNLRHWNPGSHEIQSSLKVSSSTIRLIMRSW